MPWLVQQFLTGNTKVCAVDKYRDCLVPITCETLSLSSSFKALLFILVNDRFTDLLRAGSQQILSLLQIKKDLTPKIVPVLMHALSTHIPRTFPTPHFLHRVWIISWQVTLSVFCQDYLDIWSFFKIHCFFQAVLQEIAVYTHETSTILCFL